MINEEHLTKCVAVGCHLCYLATCRW